ncbi:MAG: HEAT repeat domain-containing protein [Myxococcaceae bacterium]
MALFRKMLEQPQPPLVLTSVACAFVDLGSCPEAVELIAPFAHHPDAEVRRSVVSALLGNSAAGAVATLITLSSDDSADVRNWATFGLGSQLGEPGDEDFVDSNELREALFARIEDPDEETRAEAVVGLAARGDERVLPVVLVELQKGPSWPHYVEAARFLGSPLLCDALKSLKRMAKAGPEKQPWDVLTEVDEAIAACCPWARPSKPLLM